jgi:hypothetical protein
MNTLRDLFEFWNAHGTKALGSLATLIASLQTAVLVMNADPAHPIVSGKTVILLAGLNAFLGAWTVKRGYFNSAQNQPLEP